MESNPIIIFIAAEDTQFWLNVYLTHCSHLVFYELLDQKSWSSWFKTIKLININYNFSSDVNENWENVTPEIGMTRSVREKMTHSVAVVGITETLGPLWLYSSVTEWRFFSHKWSLTMWQSCFLCTKGYITPTSSPVPTTVYTFFLVLSSSY